MVRGAQQATVHEPARVGHNLATKPPPPYIYSDFSQTPVFSLENLVILVFTKLKRHYHQWHIVTNQVHC